MKQKKNNLVCNVVEHLALEMEISAQTAGAIRQALFEGSFDKSEYEMAMYGLELRIRKEYQIIQALVENVIYGKPQTPADLEKGDNSENL